MDDSSDPLVDLTSDIQDGFNEIIPDKSHKRYVNAYNAFMLWKESKSIECLNEEVVLAYFDGLSKNHKPSTLWSLYSILKKMLSCNYNINIAEYDELLAFIKKKNDGYQSKKSNVFTVDEMKKFLVEAPNEQYLAMKV